MAHGLQLLSASLTFSFVTTTAALWPFFFISTHNRLTRVHAEWLHWVCFWYKYNIQEKREGRKNLNAQKHEYR